MKPVLLLNSAVWFLITATQGRSIVCFSCHDSENKASCKRRLDAIDCSRNPEFGEVYDSCFSMIAINGRKAIQIKDCAIGWACDELEDILCQDYQKEQNFTCKVDCCEDDYCNEYNVGASSSTGSLLSSSTGSLLSSSTGSLLMVESMLLASVTIACCSLAFVTPW